MSSEFKLAAVHYYSSVILIHKKLILTSETNSLFYKCALCFLFCFMPFYSLPLYCSSTHKFHQFFFVSVVCVNIDRETDMFI